MGGRIKGRSIDIKKRINKQVYVYKWFMIFLIFLSVFKIWSVFNKVVFKIFEMTHLEDQMII